MLTDERKEFVMDRVSDLRKKIGVVGMTLLMITVMGLGIVEKSYAANIDSVTDPNFREYLLNSFDVNKDGDISEDEADSVDKINVPNKEIKSLAGIEMFANLKTLDCRDNQITSLNLSSNTRLESLVCAYNEIVTLDLSKNLELKRLDCFDNPLDSLTLRDNTKLENVFLGANNFKTIDLSQNVKLEAFTYLIGEMEEIDFSYNKELKYIWISTTPLKSLDLSKNSKLVEVLCYGTDLNTIELYDKVDLIGSEVNVTSNKMISIHSNIDSGGDIDTQNQRPLRVTVPAGSDSYDLGNIDPQIRSGAISDVKGATIEEGIVYGIYDGLEVTYKYTENEASLIATIIFDVEPGEIDPEEPDNPVDGYDGNTSDNDSDSTQDNKVNDKNDAPDTGDAFDMYAMLVSILLSLTVICVFVCIAAKKREV